MFLNINVFFKYRGRERVVDDLKYKRVSMPVLGRIMDIIIQMELAKQIRK